MSSRRRSDSSVKDARAKKRRADPSPMTCIVSGLCADARTAVAKGVLREMQKATILTIEEETGKQALPKKGGAFEVKVYTTADPQPLPEPANIVVLAHQLSRPSRVAAAMAKSEAVVRLVTVIDARTFCDDLEKNAPFPRALRDAAKKDERAHMHDQKVCDVLAEQVECADLIVLCQTGQADSDELSMMEEMMRALNPSVAIARCSGDGDGAAGCNLLQRANEASAERPAPAERAGWLQAVKEARNDESEDEPQQEAEAGDEDDDEDDDDDDEDDDDECEGEGTRACAPPAASPLTLALARQGCSLAEPHLTDRPLATRWPLLCRWWRCG